MAYTVDFKTVSTIGLESSPVAAALAGLRANEARYIWNKYKEPYITYPAAENLTVSRGLMKFSPNATCIFPPSLWKSAI